ncbi:MAG: class I mannose-6-phosphate isomerase [Oscillospiraceae bacterium]|nr:class I mannose-6-phosphate isomerase [Oscillospiraceae bacterium]
MDKKSDGVLYPMPLSPAFKDYLWGGQRLVDEFGKNTDLRPVAESWELSCHPDGRSIVGDGAYAGMALADVLEKYPQFVGPVGRLGTGRRSGGGASGGSADGSSANGGAGGSGTGGDASNGAGGSDTSVSTGAFPILIKLIDAKQNLSLQVHPDDDYARLHEGGSMGKNEAWYVIDCEPGARLILGLKEDAPTDKIPELIKSGAILEYANSVPVKPGDCYYVPAGLLHAIGGGALIAEVQQSSNITYRVHDYGRVGADGKPRELHTMQASAVVNSALRARNGADGAVVRNCGGCRATKLVDWRFFNLDLLEFGGGSGGIDGGNGSDSGGDGAVSLECAGSFHALLVIQGEFTIEGGDTAHRTLNAGKGACVFLPHGIGSYTVRPYGGGGGSRSGSGKILLTTL